MNHIRKLQSRAGYNNSYLNKIISKAIEVQSPMGKYFQQLIQDPHNPIDMERERLKNSVSENLTSSRRLIYMQLNPELESPTIYKDSPSVAEHHRIAYSRFRLSSHRLKIETGRWSRMPRERRLCSCGEIQDELHVLIRCPLLDDVRRLFSEIHFDSINSVFAHNDNIKMCEYIFRICDRVKEINGS